MTATLPPELARAVKIQHRSPTYAFTLIDGRALHVRREAHAFKKNGSLDLKVLAAGDGEVVWWVNCDGNQSTSKNLGDALVGAMSIPEMDADFEAFWDAAKDLMGIALGLAEDAVPCEAQT